MKEIMDKRHLLGLLRLSIEIKFKASKILREKKI